MLKAKDLRDQSIEELEVVELGLRRELFDLVNQYKQAQKLEKPHLLREKRRDIARVLTVLNEKQGTNQ